MNKKLVLITFIGIFLLSLGLTSAINLEVNTKPIQNSAIADLNEPAIFELTIKNLEKKDDFEIYSLIGIDILPDTLITIDSNETKTLIINVTPQRALESKKGSFPFEYKIKNSKNEIQKEQLVINIISLEDIFSITPQNINPKSEKIIVSITNEIEIEFNEINIQMSSAFFDYQKTISLDSLETKKIEIPINKEELKTLSAGQYLINTNIETHEKTANKESIIKFLEQADIETTESKEGIIKQRQEIIKKNIGNVKKTVKITTERNLIAYLFTTLNHPSTQTKITGFTAQYSWEEELIPNQELKIIVTTNWFYPIIIILMIIGIIFLIKRSIERDIVLRKKVSFVKTRGGEFALKITLQLKAKKFIERINITDKLPPLVNLYNRFGAIAPDTIDLKNRRLEWNIESLNKDEARIFTYIIYSKIGVVGRFELPSARATYEKEGKLKNTISNRSFFINEPKGY